MGPRLPIGQHQAVGRPQDTGDFAGRRRQVGGKMQGVDGDNGVGDGIGQPGRGQVAHDEACRVGQPEQRRPLVGLLDGDGREVHPDQGGALRLGQPQPGTATPTSQINKCLPR